MTQLEATVVWWLSITGTTGIIRPSQGGRKQGTYSICGPPHHCHLNSHHLHHKSNWLECNASSCTETHHFCTAGAPLDLQSLQEKKTKQKQNWFVGEELQGKYSQTLYWVDVASEGEITSKVTDCFFFNLHHYTCVTFPNKSSVLLFSLLQHCNTTKKIFRDLSGSPSPPCIFF